MSSAEQEVESDSVLPGTTGLNSLLRVRYAPPEWAIAFEVCDSTGARGSRYADAVAVNCYPSRGLSINGFECKVSRGDWVKELRNPDKSIAIQKYCHYWWLVVSDQKIVLDGELPEQWGLIVARGRNLVAVKNAPKLKPEPIKMEFLASLMRAAVKGTIPERHIADRVNKAYQDGERRGKENATYNDKSDAKSLEQLRKAVNTFEQAMGIKIDTWDLGNIASLVKYIKARGHQARQGIARDVANLRELAALSEAVLKDWPEPISMDDQT